MCLWYKHTEKDGSLKKSEMMSSVFKKTEPLHKAAESLIINDLIIMDVYMFLRF